METILIFNQGFKFMLDRRERELYMNALFTVRNVISPLVILFCEFAYLNFKKMEALLVNLGCLACRLEEGFYFGCPNVFDEIFAKV